MLTHQLGLDGDVQIQRMGDEELRVDADTVHITGSLSATKLLIGGLSLNDYINMKVQEALKKN